MSEPAPNKPLDPIAKPDAAEFRDKYEQPFNEAWVRALGEFRQLTVCAPDGEDDLGNPS